MNVEGTMKDSVIVGLFVRGFPATEAYSLQFPRTTHYFYVLWRRVNVYVEYSHARPKMLNGDIHA